MKRCLSVFIGIVLFISFSSANSHNASNIYLKINGADTDLQTAIDSGSFGSAYAGGSYFGNIIFGHNAIDIIVNVGGNVKSFQDAINDGSLTSVAAGISPANYGSYNLIYGEFGANVSVVSGGVTVSLQEAINTGKFYYVYVCVPSTCASLGISCGSVSNGCGGTLNCADCWYSHPATYPSNLKTNCATTCANAGKSSVSSSQGSNCKSSICTGANCNVETWHWWSTLYMCQSPETPCSSWDSCAALAITSCWCV